MPVECVFCLPPNFISALPCLVNSLGAGAKAIRRSLGLPTEADAGGTSCPMKSRRAPELATGFIGRRVREILTLSSSSVLNDVVALTDAESKVVIDNFNICRDRAEYGLQASALQNFFAWAC